MPKRIETRGRPKGQGLVGDRRDRSVGNILRRARIESELGLKDVAQHLDVSVGFISNLEHNKAPLPMHLVPLCANILNLDITKLALAALTSSHVFQQYEDLLRDHPLEVLLRESA